MLEDSIQTRGLVYLRKITGISRNHLADIFGYTPNSIARWEVDNRIPINALDTYNDLQTDFDRRPTVSAHVRKPATEGTVCPRSH